MTQNLVAESSITINASPARVWQALTDPQSVRKYMFGAEVATDWKEGSPITWKGEWQGKTYEDKGTILRVEPERTLVYTHYSPLSGVPDAPENYHTVTIRLSEVGGTTRVLLSQDNNPTEEARAHSASNWGQMLASLKSVVEE